MKEEKMTERITELDGTILSYFFDAVIGSFAAYTTNHKQKLMEIVYYVDTIDTVVQQEKPSPAFKKAIARIKSELDNLYKHKNELKLFDIVFMAKQLHCSDEQAIKTTGYILLCSFANIQHWKWHQSSGVYDAKKAASDYLHNYLRQHL